MPDGSTATRTSRSCTSTWCRRRTSRAIRTCCARAAATNRCAERTTKSTSCGRCIRRPASTAATRTASCGRTAGSRTYTAVCSPTVYRGDRLPAEFDGNVFVAEPAANLVSRIIVNDDGTTLRRAEGVRATRSSSPRPTSDSGRSTCRTRRTARSIVVDMYHGIIQHRGFITEYLRDQILSRKLDSRLGHGRIYRIVHDTTRRDPKPSLSRPSTGAARRAAVASERLVARHGAAAARRTRRSCRSSRALKKLRDVAPTATHAAARAVDARRARRLDAGDGRARARAIRRATCARRPSGWRSAGWRSRTHPVQAAVLKLLTMPDWAVRRQLAATLGALPARRPRDRARRHARATRRRSGRRSTPRSVACVAASPSLLERIAPIAPQRRRRRSARPSP